MENEGKGSRKMDEYMEDVAPSSKDKEGNMAPNSEEEGHRLKVVQGVVANNPWRQSLEAESNKPRPPVYNPEDYALSLRKWARRPDDGTRTMNATRSTMTQSPSIITLSSPQAGEMSLRQFASITDLLNKLKIDLKLALSSFVQEFVGDPVDGVTLLLELLRSIQLTQASHTGRVPPAVLRRCLLDEHSCLQCLRSCLRCQDAPRRFASSPAGLFTLAVCIMSNVSKSRILALELLTKTCEHPNAKGHGPVSDAMSTMRLRFGEPVRFRFLVGMLSGACPELLAAGIRFINTFIETAPSEQLRFYIQAELEQAGFRPNVLNKTLPSKVPSVDLVRSELNRWSKNFICIETLKSKAESSSTEIHTLKEKIVLLEKRVQILQEEKGVLSSLEKCLKGRCSELENELCLLRNCVKPLRKTSKQEGSGSTPAEDEGISSSDQDEEDIEREPLVYEMFTVQNDTIIIDSNSKDTKNIDHDSNNINNDHENSDEEETTIEEVMEELQNIINAESDYVTKRDKLIDNRQQAKEEVQLAKHYQRLTGRSTCDLTSEALILEDEADIVPERLLPQPPRRSRSLFLPERDYDEHNPFFEDEDSLDNSDSLLSTSKEPSTIGNFLGKTSYRGLTGGMGLRRRETMIAERVEAQKNVLRRRETFHHVANQKVTQQSNHNKYIKKDSHQENNRRGSFDGLFYVTHNANTPISLSEPTTKPKGTRIYIESKQDQFKRLKSKSLDRITDGLDSLVDIVVTSDQPCLHTKEDDSKDKTSSNHSSVVIVSRQPPPTYQQSQEQSKLQARYQRATQTRKQEENNHLLKYPSDRSVFLPIKRNPSPTEVQKFVLKRGHTNAGLYSGQHNICDAPGLVQGNRVKMVTSDYYNRGLNSLHHVNLSVSTGKLMDLPSGLY